MRRQIIWGHKACIQQYLQRVMNITGAVVAVTAVLLLR